MNSFFKLRNRVHWTRLGSYSRLFVHTFEFSCFCQFFPTPSDFIFSCSWVFWSIAIHFFLFLLSVGTTGFCQFFPAPSDFIFSCSWVKERLVLQTKKPSSKESVSKPEKQVHWTRFSSLETESNGLGFKAWKPSSLNSFSRLRNRQRWTRFLPTWPLHQLRAAGKW